MPLTPARLALLMTAAGIMFTCGCLVLLLMGGALLLGGGDILPGVSSVGVDLGGMSETEAANTLAQAWASSGITLRDGERSWGINPAEAGISLDAAATAANAQTWGRSDGGLSGPLRGILGRIEIQPVLLVDLAQLTRYLENTKPRIDLPPVNAGVQWVGGQVVGSPAINGRILDIAATTERMRTHASLELADGALDVVILVTAPAITDATPLIAQATALLTSPFTIYAYDPIRDERHDWTTPPEVWAGWITAQAAPTNPAGLSLSLNPAAPVAFLQAQSNFGDERYIDLNQSIAVMQDALARGQIAVTIRVWHNPTTITVQAGQTLASIADEVGIPYPYIQAENPGINADALSVGQTLTLPSKDILVPLNPVPNKRIIVSRGQQHLWAYENGQVVYDWVISTGLPTSPTALGVFQLQSHEVNAYADQWNLDMPHFMGFYHPGPNMDLLNGFHGFPTRGGGYLLWSDDLGHPVTYGCVLLSLENAAALFAWADEGVVVEVRAS
jgi:LysM repeat protein